MIVMGKVWGSAEASEVKEPRSGFKVYEGTRLCITV
jgi:hypothetical protein